MENSAQDIVAKAFAAGATLLEAAVACHNTGLSVTECAPELYKQSRVKPAALALANVLAAVWWGPIFTDPQSLGTALSACNAFPRTDIDAAAAAAMGQYHDVFVRRTLYDTGVVPYKWPDGQSHGSPDIIVTGTTQTADPAEAYGEAHYGEDFDGPFTAKEVNYIYLRARNLFPAAEPPGTTSPVPQLMAYSTYGTLSFDSKNWQQLTTANGAQAVPVSGAAGAVLVGTTPFLFTPAPLPDDQHYCIVGRVVTGFNPNPLPDTSTIAGSLDWLLNHPGFCWRNVAMKTLDTLTAGVTASIHYRNADPEPRRFALVADARNVPGMRITVTAEGADRPIDETISEDRQQVSTFVTLPGGFEGMVDVRMQSTSPIDPAGDPSVELRYYALLTPDHPGFRYTQEPVLAGIGQQDAALASGARPAFLGNYAFKFVA